MERTERLLDLVALLLDAREPITWAELRDAFPDDYGSPSDEAAERKFERDKAELLELGILYAAGSAALAAAAFPGRRDLAHALRKIGFYAGTELPSPRVRMELDAVARQEEIAPHLELFRAAAAARKWVEISYYSPRSGKTTERRVDPYGLAMRRGVWSLVGYCHLRKDIRTFQVHRVRGLKVNPAKPRSYDFEVPAGFRLEDYVANYPWQHRIDPPQEVTLSLRGDLAPLANRVFPDAKVESRAGESIAVVVATYLDGLLRYALSLGADCVVSGPASAVSRWKQMAAQVLADHSRSAKAVLRGTA